MANSYVYRLDRQKVIANVPTQVTQTTKFALFLGLSSSHQAS